MLAGSKWGSYIVPGPPYIGDIVLLLLLGSVVFGTRRGRSPLDRIDYAIGLTTVALLLWAIARLLLGSVSVTGLRDAAPYVYAVLALLVVTFTAEEERIASKLITVALVFHSAWLTIALTLPDLSVLPTLSWAPNPEGLRVFSIRGDIDIPVSGFLVALSLHRALTGRSPGVNLALASWGLALVAAAGTTRAGLVAVAMSLLIVVLLGPARARARALAPRHADPSGRWRDPRLVVATLIVLVPLAAISIRESEPFERLLYSLNVGDPQTQATGVGSVGTTRARQETWDTVIDWTAADPGRLAVGAGFGVDYLADLNLRGVIGSSEDRDDVRSPHSYWVTTLARAGLIGLALVLLLWLFALRAAFVVASKAPTIRDTDLLAILVLVSLPVAASFGVLLESPFGAIPYFWAVGTVGVRAWQLTAQDPKRPRAV